MYIDRLDLENVRTFAGPAGKPLVFVHPESDFRSPKVPPSPNDGRLSSSKFSGLADEVASDGHRLPPYNDLWGTRHYRREPCAHGILRSLPSRSTAAPPPSSRTI